jgi:hypothetical protein
MRKIQEVLRQRFEAHLSERHIAAIVGCSRSTVQQCLRRAEAAHLGWQLLPELDEFAVQAWLYPQPHAASASIVRIPAKPGRHSEASRAIVPDHAGPV